MTVTASVKNINAINTCEASSDWTGETPADVTDFYKEGTQCVGFTVRGIGNNDISISVTEDLSGTTHVRFWMMTTALKELNTDANGGVQLYLSDGTNTGYWYASGSTSYPGGWYPIVVDVSRAVDAGTKPTSMNAITTLGIRFNHTASAKNSQNTWIDNIYTGDGIIVYGDDGGSAFDFDDILTIDENTTYGWGLIRKIGGVFFTTGVIEIGDSASTNSAEFQAETNVLVFEKREVGSSNNINTATMGINIIDNGTGTTEFTLGSKSGTAGISGCVIRTQDPTQTSKYYLDFANTNVDNIKIYGSTFLDAGTTDLPASGVNVELLNNSFEKCGVITVSTAKFEYNNIISADTYGVQISSTSHGVKYCSFINCTTAAWLVDTAGTTYSSVGNSFSGNTVDIENSVNATTVDSHAIGGSDQIVGNGTIVSAGQSFTATAGVLSSAYLRLKTFGSPTGNAVAKIFASTGTNPNRTPTGTALATSNNVDVTDITASYTDVYFEFEDEYTLSASTTYFLVLEFDDGASNYLHWEYDNANGDTSNNFATYTTSWSSASGNDGRYAVHSGGIVKIGLTDSVPSSDNNTGTPPGATIMPTSVVITITVQDKDRVVVSGVQTSVQLLDSPYTMLMNEDTNASGIATENYPGTTPVDVVVKTRKSETTDDPRYQATSQIQEITSDGLTLTITILEQPLPI